MERRRGDRRVLCLAVLLALPVATSAEEDGLGGMDPLQSKIDWILACGGDTDAEGLDAAKPRTSGCDELVREAATRLGELRSAFDLSFENPTQLGCYLEKLAEKDSGIDDRVIPWREICAVSGPRSCGLPSDTASESMLEREALLRRTLESPFDVERDPALPIFLHVGSVALNGDLALHRIDLDSEIEDDARDEAREDAAKASLGALDMIIGWTNEAIGNLYLKASGGLGGESATPAAYQAIVAWIAAKQEEGSGVYGCHTGAEDDLPDSIDRAYGEFLESLQE